MSDVDAVLFDLDGTLMDHVAAQTAAMYQWLTPLGLSPEHVSTLVPYWFSLEEKHYPAWRRGEISFTEQRRRRLRDFLPAAGLVGAGGDEAALDATFGGYLAAYEEHWTAFADAAAALRRVRGAGLRVAVLTNGDHEQQTDKLTRIGLVDLCGPVLAAGALGAAKPDVRAYRHACGYLGIDARRTLMVGDNYALDVLAARAAGLRAIHLDRNGSATTPDSARIRSLDELSPSTHPSGSGATPIPIQRASDSGAIRTTVSAARVGGPGAVPRCGLDRDGRAARHY